MPEWIAPTTKALQARIVSEADGDTLVLTSGGRLARQLLHAFRMDRIKRGKGCWLPPRIMSLNAWLEESWRESWPEESLASPIRILKTWESAVRGTDLPEGLAADLPCYRLLEETYRVKIRDRLPPIRDTLTSPIILWREKVFSRFERDFKENKRLHPALLPGIILQGVQEKSLRLPRTIVLAGFDYPAPIERELLEALKRDCGAIEIMTRPQQDPLFSAYTLDSLEEEIFFLVEAILTAAQDIPLHQIAVLSPDLDTYGPKLSRAFQEVIGPSVMENAGQYNISLGQPLQRQPMVQAGLLPLRFALEGEPRSLFLSLALSPYYGLFQPFRARLAQADRAWRRNSIDAGLDRLLQGLRAEDSSTRKDNIFQDTFWKSLLQPFARGRQSGLEWVQALESCWRQLGFPSLILPGEEGIFSHLRENLRVLARDLKEDILTGPDFYAWLNHLLSQILVNEPGYEQSGLQVLGLIEARGLSIEKLFLIGMSEGSLPQPTRGFPFLLPEERKRVQGATPESQYAFAKMTFERLKAASPEIVLTRPEEEKGEKLLPSPFWPGEPVQKDRGGKNFWSLPAQAWMRADWVQQTFRGIHQVSSPHPPQEENLSPSPVPNTISATAVEMALSCPLKYFLNLIVGLNPLEKVELGISPRDRGTFLHRILASFTKRSREKGCDPEDWQSLYPLLEGLIETLSGGRLADPHWQVEKRRLIGDGQTDRGLLGKWLEQEQERLSQGWQWTGEEVVFQDLRVAGWPLAVEGRIDRVDFHPGTNQAACWDYKSGSLPGGHEITRGFLQPQLPLYLLAVKHRAVLQEGALSSLKAGYICLKSEAECRLWEPLKESALWESLLEKWVKVIEDLGRKLVEGALGADPNPRPEGRNPGACRNCDYHGLCRLWKKEQSPAKNFSSV